MAIEIKLDCTAKNKCMFRSKCLLVVHIKDGGDFEPVLKLRLIRLEKQLRCFSYAEGELNERGN